MMIDSESVRRVMKERSIGMSQAHTLLTREVILDEVDRLEGKDDIKGILFTILHEFGWDTSAYE